MTKVRPFLKWAGSKYNCLNHILASLPSGSRLIEPFGGSASVFMNTSYPSYLIAESNSDLVDIFTYLQKDGELFINHCQQLFIPENNYEERYYEIRDLFNKQERSQQKSAMFLYLNRHGYNGLCRYNSKGIFNVPFGLYSKPYFPRNEMILFQQKTLHADFIQNDFRETFALAKTGDVIYCDPPYVPLTKDSKPFTYTAKIFDEKDQIELAQLATETAAKGIPVVLSNHDTEFTRQLYNNAYIKSFPVARWINCQGNQRQPVNELTAVFM